MVKPEPLIGNLTPGLHKMLMFVRGHIETHGYAPTVREAAQQFGYASPNSAYRLFVELEKRGLLERAHAHRGVNVTERGMQIKRGETL